MSEAVTPTAQRGQSHLVAFQSFGDGPQRDIICLQLRLGDQVVSSVAVGEREGGD